MAQVLGAYSVLSMAAFPRMQPALRLVSTQAFFSPLTPGDCCLTYTTQQHRCTVTAAKTLELCLVGNLLGEMMVHWDQVFLKAPEARIAFVVRLAQPTLYLKSLKTLAATPPVEKPLSTCIERHKIEH